MSVAGVRWPRKRLGVTVEAHAHHDAEDGGVLDYDSLPTEAIGGGTPTEGFVLGIVPGGDRGWIEADAGGGAGASGFPEGPPAVPSAFDDEFTTNTLDAKWTVLLAGNGTGHSQDLDKYGTWLSHKGPGSATLADRRYQIRQPITGAAAGTAFSCTTRVAVRNNGTGDAIRVAVELGNDATSQSGSYVVATLNANGTETRAEVYDGSFDVQSTLPLGSTVCYFHIQRDTSNVVKVYYSPNGIGWSMLHSETRNWTINYLYVTLSCHSASGSPSEVLVDFVRVNDARFLQQT